MDKETMVLLTGLLGIVMVTGLLGAAIAGAYFFGRSRVERRAPKEGTSAELLAHIERMLEGLAVEVERIGEGQRYLARTLHPVPERAGIIGPHVDRDAANQKETM